MLHTVFPFSGITLDHLAPSFETGESHIGNRVPFVIRLFRRDNWSKSGEGEVDTRETASRIK
jgi:hypothetical protein